MYLHILFISHLTTYVSIQVGKIQSLNDGLSVSDILMACQAYMRERKVHFTYSIYMHCNNFLQDECSFVSLRDIERAMIVLEWFHSVLDHIERDDLYKDTVCRFYVDLLKTFNFV